MLLLVGLGNPGPTHAHNRHNVGFMAADVIVRAHPFGPFRKRFHGEAAEGLVAGIKVLVLKPLTYMNESGRAVADAARFYRLPPESITVVHDDIDLAFGKVRTKLGGGSAGHNGLRSIDDHLGNGYRRIRIGVGRPPPGGDVMAYVLRDFAKADRKPLAKTLAAIAESLPLLVEDDAPGFMTRVALLAPPPRPAAPKVARAKAEKGPEAAERSGARDGEAGGEVPGAPPAGRTADDGV